MLNPIEKKRRTEEANQRRHDSEVAFRTLTWPIARNFPKFRGAEDPRLLPVEDWKDKEQEALKHLLDNCGIDAYFREQFGQSFGIASRTHVAKPNVLPQHVKWKPQDNPGQKWFIPKGFYIRYKPGSSRGEFHRLQSAINRAGYTRPVVSVESVFLNNLDEPPVYVAMVETKVLIDFIETHKGDPKMVATTKVYDDGNQYFFVCSDDLRTEDTPVYEYFVVPKQLFEGTEWYIRGVGHSNCPVSYVEINDAASHSHEIEAQTGSSGIER